MTSDATAAVDPREMWRAYEPVHAVVYFAPESREEYAGAGLKGSWMGYFASRSAPMGAVGSEAVVATFHNFRPQMVRRAIPDAWSFSDPERVLAARLRVADVALHRLLGEAAEGPEIEEAAELAQRAVAAAATELGGRPLFAAHAALPVPEEPLLSLWHACGALREHRFDGHVAMLTGYGVGGLEALILHAGSGGTPREILQPSRGWTDEEWSAAEDALRQRGFLDAEGDLTERGLSLHDAVERRTDDLARTPLEALGHDLVRLHALLVPLSARIAAGGGIPPVSPLGLRVG